MPHRFLHSTFHDGSDDDLSWGGWNQWRRGGRQRRIGCFCWLFYKCLLYLYENSSTLTKHKHK
jgi:hypothetical protein